MPIIFEPQKKKSYLLLGLAFFIISIAIFVLVRNLNLFRKSLPSPSGNQGFNQEPRQIINAAIFKEIENLDKFDLLPEIPEFEGEFGKSDLFNFSSKIKTETKK